MGRQFYEIPQTVINGGVAQDAVAVGDKRRAAIASVRGDLPVGRALRLIASAIHQGEVKEVRMKNPFPLFVEEKPVPAIDRIKQEE